jgi:hypothetical protein
VNNPESSTASQHRPDERLNGVSRDARQLAKRHRIPVNPRLPEGFDSTPNAERPASHDRWWGRPYIETETGFNHASDLDRRAWFAAWPSGTRYDVRCLDGGAWDRSTWQGSFTSLEEAVHCAIAVRERMKHEGVTR